MSADPDFSSAAALLAEPARAAILARLLDGRSWTATELAKAAGVAPSTGSLHLAKILEVGWVLVHPQGRYRYYRLSGGGIASFLEGFAGISPAPPMRTPGEQRAAAALRHCRFCYDHVAGQVGVAFTEGLLARGWLTAAYHLTAKGECHLAALGLRVPSGEGRSCMDWSERRLHLAGIAGRSLAAALLAADWFQRDLRSRALWVTPRGEESLTSFLGETVRSA
jgi:DNA-binding transcriptional ArsR family regulator